MAMFVVIIVRSIPVSSIQVKNEIINNTISDIYNLYDYRHMLLVLFIISMPAMTSKTFSSRFQNILAKVITNIHDS